MSELAAELRHWGRTIGSQPGIPRLRRAAIAIAAAILTLAFAASTLTVTTLAGRDARSRAADPQAGSFLSGEPSLLWMPLHFDTLDNVQVTVIGLEPLKAGAPLPPGVDRWPAPGEAVVSPALARDLPARRAARYGKVVGTIRQPGLISPTVYLVYMRLTPDQLADAKVRSQENRLVYPASGFGNGLWEPQSAELEATSRVETVGGPVVFLILPALALVLVVNGVGMEARGRRWHTLKRLGMSRSEYRRLELAYSAAPAARGAITGMAFALATVIRNTPVPLTGFELDAHDARRAVPWIVLGAVIAWSVTLAIATTPPRSSRHAVTAASAQVQPLPLVAALIAPLAVVAMFTVPELIDARLPSLALYEATFLLVLVTVPALVSVLIARFGLAIARRSARFGRTTGIVAGRQLASGARRTRQVATIVTAAILITGQAAGFASAFSEQYAQAKIARQQLGTTVLMTRSAPNSPGFSRFIAALPPNVIPLGIHTREGSDKGAILFGDCQQLTRLTLPCPTSPAALGPNAPRSLLALQEWTTTLSVQAGLAQGDADGLALISADGSHLDEVSIQNMGYRFVAGGLAFDALGERWIVAATSWDKVGKWVRMLGTLSLAILLTGMTLRIAADILHLPRALGPLAVLSGRPTVFAGIAAWRLLIMLLGSAIIAAPTYWIAARALEHVTPNLGPQVTFIEAAIVVTVSLALLGTALAGLLCWRLALTWRPGAPIRG